jgi:hypothetical protein
MKQIDVNKIFFECGKADARLIIIDFHLLSLRSSSKEI